MKYPQENILDPEKTYEKKLLNHEIPRRKKDKPTILNLSHETPTRKVSDQLITHEGTMEQGNHTQKTHDATRFKKFITLLFYVLIQSVLILALSNSIYKDSNGLAFECLDNILIYLVNISPSRNLQVQK